MSFQNSLHFSQNPPTLSRSELLTSLNQQLNQLIVCMKDVISRVSKSHF